jgi:hypothetical protein
MVALSGRRYGPSWTFSPWSHWTCANCIQSATLHQLQSLNSLRSLLSYVGTFGRLGMPRFSGTNHNQSIGYSLTAKLLLSYGNSDSHGQRGSRWRIGAPFFRWLDKARAKFSFFLLYYLFSNIFVALPCPVICL